MHQVFIERCRDNKDSTKQALAKAISDRYGVDPSVILARLARGRFQVKANVSIEKATAFVEFLEKNGGLCSIVDKAGKTIFQSKIAAAATMLGAPMKAPGPVTPNPVDNLARPVTLAQESDFVPLHTPLPKADPSAALEEPSFESGLAAAFGGASAQELGALGEASASAFQLDTLDGAGTEAEATKAPAAVAVEDINAFLPPGVKGAKALELDVEPPEAAGFRDTGAEAGTEPSPVAPPTTNPLESGVLPRKSEAIRSQSARLAAVDDLPEARKVDDTGKTLFDHLESHRVRLAMGTILAVLLAFVAVHLVASSREDSRYGEVVSELKDEYSRAESPESWAGLSKARSDAQDRLASRKTNIVLTSIILWIVLVGGLLFSWMRFTPWGRDAEQTT